MEWKVRDLAANETHALRRAVSADGPTDLTTMHHDLDDSPGAWHLGAVDATGRVLATSSLYVVASPHRSEFRPAVQLQFMAVDPAWQRRGLGSAVMAEIIRRLRESGTALLWSAPAAPPSRSMNGSGSRGSMAATSRPRRPAAPTTSSSST
jgi:GNAT superfamily N-acetyltransferase